MAAWPLLKVRHTQVHNFDVWSKPYPLDAGVQSIPFTAHYPKKCDARKVYLEYKGIAVRGVKGQAKCSMACQIGPQFFPRFNGQPKVTQGSFYYFRYLDA